MQKNIISSSFKGIIIAIIAQFVVDMILSLTKDKKFENLFKKENLLEYYAAVVVGAINGALLIIVPKRLFGFAAIIVGIVTYQFFLNIEDISKINFKNLVINIIRDSFIIYLVLYLIDNFKENIIHLDKDINDLFIVTVITSLVINISLAYSRIGLNAILNLNESALVTSEII